MKTLITILAIATSLNAHAIGQRIEPLLGIRTLNSAVKIQVQSGGCTWKESFTIKKDLDRNTGVIRLAFVRVVPDYCEAYFPDGRILTYSYEDLKLESGQSFQIVNPLAVNRVPDDAP